MSNALENIDYEMESGQHLNAETVKEYLITGDKNLVTDQEVMMFLELCKAQNLNPFLKDRYLIKFGQKAAQIIVGKDVFIKRAYESPDFDGMQAGIVVRKNGKLEYREGALALPNEDLVGGWCTVYLKNRKIPVKAVVSYNEYVQRNSYGKVNAIWSSKGATMIRKVAQSQALREAFPSTLRGLYQEEEMGIDRTNYKENVIEAESETVVIEAEEARETKGTDRASKNTKVYIMQIAAEKELYAGDKDTTKLEEFCEFNGLDLHNLTEDEAQLLIELINDYRTPFEDETEDKTEEGFVDFDEQNNYNGEI